MSPSPQASGLSVDKDWGSRLRTKLWNNVSEQDEWKRGHRVRRMQTKSRGEVGSSDRGSEWTFTFLVRF